MGPAGAGEGPHLRTTMIAGAVLICLSSTRSYDSLSYPDCDHASIVTAPVFAQAYHEEAVLSRPGCNHIRVHEGPAVGDI